MDTAGPKIAKEERQHLAALSSLMSTSADFCDFVDATFSKLTTSGVPGIAWHVEHNGQLYEGQAGDGEPVNGEEQSWHWGRCTQALTATVIASLASSAVFADGLDTALRVILPEVTGSPLGMITLRQLATHRSGCVENLEPAAEAALLVCAACATGQSKNRTLSPTRVMEVVDRRVSRSVGRRGGM